MSREAHVRNCEGVGVRFPHATRLRYHSLSLNIAKYPLHQIIGLRAESMPPCEVIGLFLLAFHFLSLSVGAILGS